MNWKTVVIAIACFATGLLAGAIFFRTAPAQSLPVTFKPAPAAKAAAPRFDEPAPAPSLPAPVTKASTKTPPSPAKSKSLAGFEAAIRGTRLRWDMGELYRAIDGLDASQYADAMSACLKATDSMGRYAALYAIGARWGKTDPQAALAFCETLGNSMQRLQAIASILTGWAEKDSAAAMAYAKELPTGQMRNQAVSAVAAAVAAQDPRVALTFVNSLPSGQARQSMIYSP